MATNMTSSTCDGFKSIKISPGCIVKCTTCLNELKHGEVVAFDSHQKIMILSKCRILIWIWNGLDIYICLI